MSGVISADDLARVLDIEMNAAGFKDYCPNGLQVANRKPIAKLITGVTASDAFLEAAIAEGADAVLLHHGLFWKGDDGRLTGFRYRRVRRLIEADVALLAYHLPLDAHPTLGNNAQLAQRLGIAMQGVIADAPHVAIGEIPAAQNMAVLAQKIEKVLARVPLVIGDPQRAIKRVAWCTGGGQNFFESAIAAGADAYITGEISEQHVHIARETGVVFIAAGHHATERYGVQALGAWAAQKLGIAHAFIDIDSPV